MNIGFAGTQQLIHPSQHMKRHVTLVKRRLAGGFTLIEMLAVLAIVSVVTALATFGLSGSKSSAQLGGSCNQVANLVELAKQTAVSKNEMTALVVITDPAVSSRNQVLVIYELQAPTDGTAPTAANWKQVTSFAKLQSGVVVDPSSSTFTFNNSTDSSSTTGVPSPPFPAISYDGQTVGSFKYVVFTAGGSLLSGTSATIRISPGVFPAGSGNVVYTGGVNNGVPLNYYNITILAATGNIKIDRP
jgi:prepilin-type N-terminal cleavage/methylation domain-containing protein